MPHKQTPVDLAHAQQHFEQSVLVQAMAELKKRPSMPLQHLWQAGNIVNSEPGCIQALLNDIARAYK